MDAGVGGQGGGQLSPQFFADQLTLFGPGEGGHILPAITTAPPPPIFGRWAGVSEFSDPLKSVSLL